MSYISDITDYLEFSANPLSMPFTENLRCQSFNVTIVDDTHDEPVENFTVSLTLESVENFDLSRVTVDPDLATVTITANSKCCQYVITRILMPSRSPLAHRHYGSSGLS